MSEAVLTPPAEAPAATPGTLFALPALLLAAGLIAALLAGAVTYGRRLERHSIHGVAWELAREREEEAQNRTLQRMERIKNQGMCLQREALSRPDLVSLYGSSELRKPIPNKAGLFFSEYPSGFAVFQVGKAGSTSLVLLQKVAAAAPEQGKRHLAFSLSSTWFLQDVQPNYYRGNFSLPQAMRLIFEPRLSWELKHDLARRMLEFPETVEDNALLRFTLERLAHSSWRDRLLYTLVRPLGWLQNLVYSGQDHFESVLYLLDVHAQLPDPVVRNTAPPNWPALIAIATAETPARLLNGRNLHDRRVKGERSYLSALSRSPEWDDLELLLRTCQELKLEPLVLSMPPSGEYYEQLGVPRESLLQYSRRLHALCEKYQTPVETFDDHIDDPAFLTDHHDHMTAKGWTFYNQALDNYFHRRPRW